MGARMAGRYTMAWEIGDIIKQKPFVRNRDMKNIQMGVCYVMLIRGSWAIHIWEKVYSQGVTGGKREHST